MSEAFVFAVKSTDSLSFFENSAEYVHIFFFSEKDGRRWLESVLLARVSHDSPSDENVASQRYALGWESQGTIPPDRSAAVGRCLRSQQLPHLGQIPLGSTTSNPGRCWPSDDRYVPFFLFFSIIYVYAAL